MTRYESFALFLMLIAMACLLGGLPLVFIGGVALGSLKCASVGTVLALCGAFLFVAVDHL